MTLKDYAGYINELAKKYPNSLVVYSTDEEGNYFDEVAFSPTLGKYHDGQFVELDDEDDIVQRKRKGKLAVCVN